MPIIVGVDIPPAPIDKIAPTVTISDDISGTTVKKGDKINIVATFVENDKIDEQVPPKITVGDVVVNQPMTKTSNLVWSYSWTVTTEKIGTALVVINAKDSAGNSVASTTGKTAYTIVDLSAPIPGNNGTIATSNVAKTQISLSWSAATDETTASADLKYLVFYSKTNSLDTVANALASGTAVGTWTTNLLATDVKELIPNSKYWFAVATKDEAGNKALYTQVSATMDKYILPSRAVTLVNDGGMSASIGNSPESRNIAIDEKANIHIVWVNTADNTVRYSQSTNGGASFSASKLIGTGVSGVEPIIACAPGGYVYIAYKSGDTETSFARSVDRGSSWSGATAIPSFAVKAGLSMTTHNSNIYLIGHIATGVAAGNVDFIKSTDYGKSFSAPITNVLGKEIYFQDVLVDLRNGNVLVIGDQPQIYLAKSTDKGSSFSAGSAMSGAPSINYSDYTISLDGKVLAAGSVVKTLLYDIDTAVAKTGATLQSASNLQRAVMWDANNQFYFVRSDTNATVSYEKSDSSGVLLTNSPVTIASGTNPDVAGNFSVQNVGIVFQDGTNIKYFAP